MLAQKKSSRLQDTILVIVTVLFCTIFAEGTVRALDGRPLFAFPLGTPVGSATVSDELLDRIPRAAGVERAWFFTDPAPLANRGKTPDEWESLFRRIEANPTDPSFRPVDAFKAWNAVAAGDACKHGFLRHAPDHLLLFDPVDGVATPSYRFPPNATLPTGLVTNQIGWRGKPIEVPRGERTIRIVFVGSSTVLDFHHLPFSYPEFVGHWLNQWAAARHPGLRFEVLNSARESNLSRDLVSIVRNEVLPLRPDLVVYSEGGNQFNMRSVIEQMPEGKPFNPAASASNAPAWLIGLARYSALVQRIVVAAGMAGADDGREWPKPEYKFVWPQGLDEKDPDLGHPRLPVALDEIQPDLDRIRTDLQTIGADLALASFIWMVKDGLVLNPVRHRYLLEQLNIQQWPYRYRDLERLARFQNRFFAKYAKVHGLAYLDVEGRLPFEPDLFADAVHSNYGGVRVRGWVMLQELIPVIERRLADRSWPKPRANPEPPLPTYVPRRVSHKCS